MTRGRSTSSGDEAPVLRGLTTLARDDERDWIEQLHLQYGSELRRFLQRRVRVRAVAEELEQETYLKLQRWRETDTRNPQALLFTTASNLASTYLARARTESSVVERSDAEEVADTAVTPSRAAELDEAIRQMEKVVEGMPRRLREVWIMHVVDGRSLEQIAHALGITIDAADQRYRRGTISLRQKLSRLGIDEVLR